MSLINGDSDKKIKLYEKLEQFGPLLSVLAFISGVVYFCMLPHQLLTHGTYISENALLPGLVSSDIYSTDRLINFYDYLKNSYETNGGKNYNADLIHDIFTNQIKIESFTQNFNLSYPFSNSLTQKSEELTKSGKNVYAFGRAQRADGTESIVISAPLYLTGTRNKQIPNLFGMAQLFILADLAKDRPYWAKDLIFVVTDMGHVGMQAWINSYFETQSDFIKGENLKTRGGSIQAALNLEFRDINVNKLEMKLEGANGKLPNLDLFNTIIRICKTVQFECSLESEKSDLGFSYYHNRPPIQHIPGIFNSFNMIFKQAVGVPNSLNGYFLNHRIEALTITSPRSSVDKNIKRSRQNVLKAIRVVEGTLRSVNNLLERFHQSFFFYLLSSSNYYISIGMYMPAFGLLILPVLIKVLTLWFSVFFKKESETNESASPASSSIMLGLFKTLVTRVLLSAVFGIMLYFGTSYFIYFGKKFNLSAKDSLINCYVAIIVNILAVPFVFRSKLASKENEKVNEMSEKLSRLFILLALTIFVGTISLLNFSLAFLIALFYSPISILAVLKINNKLMRLMRYLVMILACPIVYFSALYLIYLNYFENVNLFQNYEHLFKSMGERFYDFILISKISDIWTYDMVNLFLVPIWSALWLISFN